MAKKKDTPKKKTIAEMQAELAATTGNRAKLRHEIRVRQLQEQLAAAYETLGECVAHFEKPEAFDRDFHAAAMRSCDVVAELGTRLEALKAQK